MTSASSPAPVRQIANLISQYVDRLGAVWVEGQYDVTIDGDFETEEEFLALLDSLRLVDDATRLDHHIDEMDDRVKELRQLRRDHRTLVMLLVLPTLLMSLLWWMFADLPGDLFDRFGPGLLAMFPFIVMFLVTSVTTLRERSGGTLERLLAMPMGKLDFLFGYAIAFGLTAAVQSAIAVAVSVGLLGMDVEGPVWLLGVVAVADAVLGTALGINKSHRVTVSGNTITWDPPRPASYVYVSDATGGTIRNGRYTPIRVDVYGQANAPARSWSSR